MPDLANVAHKGFVNGDFIRVQIQIYTDKFFLIKNLNGREISMPAKCNVMLLWVDAYVVTQVFQMNFQRLVDRAQVFGRCSNLVFNRQHPLG